MTDDRAPSFYHVCFAVPDLQAAMDELTDLVGVTWGEPIHSRLGDWPYSLVFSPEFPHFELVSSVEGSPWYAEQPHFHHLGWWTHCLSITDRRWQDDGATPYFDGRDHGRRFIYLDAPASGARLEAVDASQGRIHRTLGSTPYPRPRSPRLPTVTSRFRTLDGWSLPFCRVRD